MNQTVEQARRRAFGAAMANMRADFSRCWYPGGNCNGDAIRAHSVQNARMLELLQLDGHVIAPRLEATLQGGPRISFDLIGRNHATTFYGLCGEHDTQMFAPIEVAQLNLQNPEHLFLLSYRAVLKEAHATAKSARDTQAGYRAGVDAGLFPAEACAPGMLAVEHMSLAYMTHLHKQSYDDLYVNGRWNDVVHFTIDLNCPASLAVNSLLSTGVYSSETDSPAYATLNVFPHDGTTILLFSYFPVHQRGFNRSFRRFLQNGNLHQKLSYLVLKRCENFVIAPALYNTFSAQQKAECLSFFERNIGEHEFEPARRDLVNIFEAVQ